MRQPLVVGNWKMNGSAASIQSLLEDIKNGMATVARAAVGVCPPYVYLQQVSTSLMGSSVGWGVQNISQYASGAYTGEIAVSMLKDFGCHYVIVGHSERRNIYGESDQVVAEKFAATQAGGFLPILCVGELLKEREAGNTEKVVQRQLDAIINLKGVTALGNAVIAYEPVWAIGTGKTASPQQAQDVHAFIRQHIAKQDAAIAEKVQILYGGSVKGSNAIELFAMTDVDGGLIGGAALNAEEFLAICHAG